jgi:hypothetical protein
MATSQAAVIGRAAVAEAAVAKRGHGKVLWRRSMGSETELHASLRLLAR